MRIVILPLLFISILLRGAIFGFFYAWVCSTMWGLDTLDPNTAIAAMNAMNISVRNGVFLPAFMGTPLVLGLTGILAVLGGYRRTGVLVLAGAGLYIAGAFIPTATINVPMNIALEVYDKPLPLDRAQAIWDDYSPTWQFWNTGRTIVSGGTLLLVALGLRAMPRDGS